MRLSWVFRLALVIGAGALLVTATVAAVGPRMWRIANAHEEDPVQLPDFATLAQRSYVYDMSGREIASFELENSQPIELADVPDYVVEAFLAVEDSEFWVHHGVNVRGLFRATLSNFATEGPIQGASTITMQVVKNDYMAGFERDGRYKVLQATYAVRLEKQKSKQQILERYLNTVFFGQNSYGIAAATETYFGKPVQELTPVEAAFLAGLVQAPSSYDPINNPERSRTRFRQVLDRLESLDMLTEEERIVEEENFVLPERVRRRPERVTERTYFTEALRDYLLNRSDILGDTYQERYVTLNRGGLRIHTTLDPALQADAEEARNELPDNALGIDAALTSLDVKTGAIRAMVGGQGFVPGRNEVNLALAPSQTGSSIKIFILAAALQAGATPDDIIDGVRGCRLPNPGNNEEPFFEIQGGVPGSVATLRAQTEGSVNCAFARLSQIVGLNRMVDTVYRMASNPYLYQGQSPEEREPIRPFASFATGGNEMSTLDMASGIQSIANEGVHHEPYYVEFIDDAFGERVYSHVDAGIEVLDRDVALSAIDTMKGVLTRGTAMSALADFASRRPAFGKTGTQQSNWTSFFVGATPELATAVLVRDPDRYTSMVNVPEFLAVGVDRVQGGTFPARIWGAYNEQVGLGQLGEQFEFTDFAAPPALPARPPARLYLPGNECLFEIVGYDRNDGPATGPAPGPAPTPAPDTVDPAGFGRPQAPAPTEPPSAEPAPTAPPEGTQPPSGPTPPRAPGPTQPPRPVFGQVESGTTIPPDVVDPNAPLPSTETGKVVRPCGE
ncbi:MAG: transglycosylase domain-containing protein [Ilumatobacteraceae bacterium]